MTFLHGLDRSEQSKNRPLILDLRGCDGGNLHEAIEAASLFLKPNATIVTSFDGLNTKTVYRSSKTNAPVTHRPLILLVDGQTASAGEVFMAALSYSGNAVTVGTTTCGKCTSQTTITLKGGAALKLTDFKLHYPSGDYCAGRGLLPDISIINANDDGEAIKRGIESVKNKKIHKKQIMFGTGHCGALITKQNLSGNQIN